MGGSLTPERKLTGRFGYTADGSWKTRSKAAAYIGTGDWALEHPFPVPPKVHVRPHRKWRCINPTLLCGRERWDCPGTWLCILVSLMLQSL